jgi:hypothetical protein
MNSRGERICKPLWGWAVLWFSNQQPGNGGIGI